MKNYQNIVSPVRGALPRVCKGKCTNCGNPDAKLTLINPSWYGCACGEYVPVMRRFAVEYYLPYVAEWVGIIITCNNLVEALRAADVYSLHCGCYVSPSGSPVLYTLLSDGSVFPVPGVSFEASNLAYFIEQGVIHG